MEEFNILWLVLSCIFCFSFCFLLCLIAQKWVRKVTLGDLENENKNWIMVYFLWFLRHGFNCLKTPSSFLYKRVKILKSFIDRLQSILSEKYGTFDNVSVVSFLLGFSILIFAFFSLLFWSLLAGFAILLLIWVSLVLFVNNKTDVNVEKIRKQIPETLRFMSACFGAGNTIPQTFSQIANDSKGQVSNVFKRCVNAMRSGSSISESLKILESYKDLSELSFIAIALDVQHQTGGSMQPVIESAKDMAVNKIELYQMLKTQTAQAKLSARIVVIMPFALIAVFSVLSPGFLQPFVSSLLGIVLLLLAIAMQFGGIVLVKKMLDIKL